MSIAHQDNLVEAVETDPVDGVDFLRRFDLPPLRRMAAEEARAHVDSLQVIRRLHALGLVERELLTPEWQWKAIYQARRREQDLSSHRGEPVGFEGTNVSGLNRFLRESGAPVVRVLARELDADETLRVPSRTTLIGAPTSLTARSPIESAVEIRDASSVRVSNFEITGRYRVGVHVKNGSSITLDGNHLHDIEGRAIVVMGRVAGLDLIRNEVRSNGRGGLYLRGHIGPGLIQDNRIEDNRGTLNLTAGLVLSSRPVFDVHDPEGGEPAGTRPLPLQERLESPHDLVIRRNVLDRNASSGLYCCGVYHVYMIENIITGNDKEGICIDYGTVGSYIRGNRIADNGGRRRQADDDLRNDFVLHLGRMRDGSSNAKLPGVSVDNSACNIIHENTVSGNFGGGIKTVRTGVRNLISHNLVIDNNRGQNSIFHFFGIEIGNPAPDEETNDLDFVPGFENMVFRNVIGGNHFAGIILVEGCYRNDLFDNCIFGPTAWSIECLSGLENPTVNNISNVPSRGISLGPTAGRDAAPRPPEGPARPPESAPARPEGVIARCGRRVRSWYEPGTAPRPFMIRLLKKAYRLSRPNHR